jgi:ABC-2 type transport system permease protein
MSTLIYEWYNVLRERWAPILIIALVALCFFAASNGREKVEKRQTDIDRAMAETIEGDSLALLLIDSLSRGLEVSAPFWRRPHQPTAFGNNHPRVAAMPPAPLALVAVGQSDLYTHYVRPRLTDDHFMLNYTELVNPVQLLFGSFDLAFVLIYLLPLLALAFSYDLLSGERERGVLPLLAAQPMPMWRWLAGKALLRYVALAGATTAALLLALAWNGVALGHHFAETGRLLGLVCLYLLFWFALAFLVNLYRGSSAFNAVALLGCWIAAVLLLPAMVSQLGNTLFPMPSRALMINDLRQAQSEAREQADSLLAGYYRDHPELMPRDSALLQASLGWKRYFASRELIERKMAPTLARYEEQILQQQAWTRRLRFASPAMLLQDGLQELAVSSTDHYEAYREQVRSFAEQWRGYFLPKVFLGQTISAADIPERLPRFQYRAEAVPSRFAANVAGLLFFLGISLALCWARYPRGLGVRLAE